MEQGCFIDLDEQPMAASAQSQAPDTPLEVSLSGHPPAVLPAGQAAVTADTNSTDTDPFAGFDALMPQHSAGEGSSSSKTPQVGPGPHEQQQQPTPRPAQQDHQQDTSSAACLKAAAERAAHTSDVLQQHSIEQGESNAKLRLLLATVAAKQVKARKMLADLSSDFSTAITDSHSSSLQQIHDLTERLQQAHQQVSAAQADAEQQRKLAAQQAELTQLRDSELQQLRAELKALRKAESRLRAELRERESRLLEAQAALSKLSAELPGSRQLASVLESLSDDVSTAVGSSVISTSPADADAADTADSGTPAAAGALPLTPVGSTKKQRGSKGGLGAGVGGSMGGGGLNILTPDQAAAAQYKDWLSASQQALIEAQDELLAREAEIKQLKQQLQQQQGGEQRQQEPQREDTDQHAPEQPHQQQEQEQQLQKLHAALDAASAAAAERDRLASDLVGLRSELMQLRLQLDEADSARSEAVASLEALQQQQQHQQEEEPMGQQVDAEAAAAAAEQAAAAEAELQEALAAAAKASAEVESLHQQLQQLQKQQLQQQQAGQSGSLPQANAAADKQAAAQSAAAAAGAEGGDVGLLQANIRIHVLQEELQDTQDSMRVLLQLVRKSAAAAAAAALNNGSTQAAVAAAAAGALSGAEQQQLQGMLSSSAAAECKDTPACKDTPDAVSTAAAAEGKPAPAAADVRFEFGVLHGLLQKLEYRYSTPKPLQDVMRRGKEMELLLSTALQRVHAIKQEAGGGGCICPTDADYRHPVMAAQSAGQQQANGTPMHHHQQQHLQQQMHSFALIDTAGGDGFAAGLHSGDGWLQGPVGDHASGYGAVSESSVSASGYSSYTQSAGGGWESWAGQGPTMGGSCSGDALQSFGGNGVGAGAVGGGVGVVAGGGVGALAPLPDERLGYDGLDGAWWASSTIGEHVTELPDFLLKKD